MRWHGVAWYPEYWPESRWDEDLRLMRETGVDLVRVGEFAWSAMEPEDGRFEFGWLADAVARAHRAGIATLLCTPGAAPPAWLTVGHPETTVLRLDGRRARHGGRRHACLQQPAYRERANRVAGALADAARGWAGVMGWQLDNEFGPEAGWCHCDRCQAAFRAWLRGRHGSVAALNAAWKTRFWSIEYSAWEQVRLAEPHEMSAARLDTRRYRSDDFRAFAAEQAAAVRSRAARPVPVTTNGMGPLFKPIDYQRLYADLDRAAVDLYYDLCTQDANALTHSVFRGIKPGTPFWLTETGSGALSADKAPDPRQLRAWAWSAWAAGCEMLCYFRWRTALSGQEQELQGILEHSGRPGRRQRAVAPLFGEFAALRPRLLAAPLPTAQAAIIADQQAHWCYASSRVEAHVEWPRRVLQCHRALHDRHVGVDVVGPDRDLAAYRLVVLPSQAIVDAGLAERLRAFVAAGGTLLSLPQLACRDADAAYLPAPPPVGLEDVFGLRVVGGTYLRSFVAPDEALFFPAQRAGTDRPRLRARFAHGAREHRVEAWMEDLELAGGTALAEFADDLFAGAPAIVERRHAAGRALYVAGYPTDDLLDDLVAHLVAGGVLGAGPATPRWVEVVRRGDLVVVVNHRAEPVEVPLAADEVLVGTWADGVARLAAYDVCVVRGRPGA